MFGTLTLGAQQAPAFSLERLGSVVSGEHCSGRYSGKYELETVCADHREISIPARDKHLDVYLESSQGEKWLGASSRDLDFYERAFSTLDSDYPGEPWLSKLEHTRRSCVGTHTVVVNSTSTHGSFSLLSNDDPLYLLGIHDPQLNTSHLVWGTDDCMEAKIRQMFPLRFLVYRFPTIVNRSVFLPTQTICAHWWRYCRNDILFAYNALELKLMRDIDFSRKD